MSEDEPLPLHIRIIQDASVKDEAHAQALAAMKAELMEVRRRSELMETAFRNVSSALDARNVLDAQLAAARAKRIEDEKASRVWWRGFVGSALKNPAVVAVLIALSSLASAYLARLEPEPHHGPDTAQQAPADQEDATGVGEKP